MGRPHLRATCLARYGASGELALRTFPMQTELTNSGFRPMLCMAPLEANTWRSTGLWPFRDPPNVPNGVLLAATTKTPLDKTLPTAMMDAALE